MRAKLALAAIAAALVATTSATSVAAAAAATPARLIIPRLGLDAAVGSTLALGPAFYPHTGKPGGDRTVAIAGHRTTHTHPFWSLNELHRGNVIVVVWNGKRFLYRVTGSRVVPPNDWAAVADVGWQRLVLSTCNPRFSARQRLLVYALPVKSS